MLQLPAGDPETSILQLSVHVRDTLNCVKKVQFANVTVRSDLTKVNEWINMIQNYTDNSTNQTNTLIDTLNDPDLNRRTQTFTLFSDLMNDIGNNQILSIVKGKIFDSIDYFTVSFCFRWSFHSQSISFTVRGKTFKFSKMILLLFYLSYTESYVHSRPQILLVVVISQLNRKKI